MQVLSPAAERDLAARELATLARSTLDEHWAVAAVPAERRTLLLERAEAASLVPGVSKKARHFTIQERTAPARLPQVTDEHRGSLAASEL